MTEINDTILKEEGIQNFNSNTMAFCYSWTLPCRMHLSASKCNHMVCTYILIWTSFNLIIPLLGPLRPEVPIWTKTISCQLLIFNTYIYIYIHTHTHTHFLFFKRGPGEGRWGNEIALLNCHSSLQAWVRIYPRYY